MPRRAWIVALMAATSLMGWRLGVARQPVHEALVTAVVDGDTIEVAWTGRSDTVRLLGVDTPETVHPARPVECFGPEASEFTRRRLLGRTVRLSFDRVRRDPYGRLLAYVEVDGGRFNDLLLATGHARLLVIPPNGTHGRAMLSDELSARAAGVGLWAACEETGRGHSARS